MNPEKILSTITQNPAELEIKDVVHHGPCDEYRVVLPVLIKIVLQTE